MAVVRKVLKVGIAIGAMLYAGSAFCAETAPVAGGTLDPTSIPQFVTPLTIPPVMPAKGVEYDKSSKKPIPYYEIEVVQFEQQILPTKDKLGKTLRPTPVWSYGAVGQPETRSYPARTIETLKDVPARVKWVNNLKDAKGKYLKHLLPIDQTLHWANPPMDCIDPEMGMPGMAMTDCRGQSQAPYAGPVPFVTHLHGAHVQPDSDGHPMAWYLPAANNIQGYARQGSEYDDFFAGSGRDKGYAVYQYPNDQRSTTLWYHDHTLGMTRANVYSGAAGFYLIRDPKDLIIGLPGPAPLPGMDPNKDAKARKLIREIPIVIQDKSFNVDATGKTSLFFPDNRAFFESLTLHDHPEQFSGAGHLLIPFIPDTSISNRRSDVSPIWNPEFFGNTMVVNGKTWPYLNVEQSRYRLRFLNACDSRFLILATDYAPGLPFRQIGADGGFLPASERLDRLLIAPAERADVIVDFSNVPVGTEITLVNLGPDEPFGGGEPGVDFAFAHTETTGRVMKFIVGKKTLPDFSKPADKLVLPARTPLGEPTSPVPRKLSLNEDMSMTVCADFVGEDVVELPCDQAPPFGPTSARLGVLDETGNPVPKYFMDDITENPALGDTEVWEIYNFTADAHPIHIHLVQFEVVNREALVTDSEGISAPPATFCEQVEADADPDNNCDPMRQPFLTGPAAWETGTKDTVIVYPGSVTRVKAKFDLAGKFIWHCHILSHEDNEMMRPYYVGPMPAPMP